MSDTVRTRGGVEMDRREYEQAWQVVMVVVCTVVLAVAAIANLCWRGCARRTPAEEAVAIYEANWDAGIYGDELADFDEIR